MTVLHLRPPRAVHVVVPARDEERTLPAHLAALGRAVERLRATWPRVPVAATLVLDDCSDGSAALARRAAGLQPWLELLEVAHGNVGQARAAGVARARTQHTGLDPRQVWLASTDADSLVPGAWLVHHARVASTGVELLTGTVRPTGLGPAVEQRWHAAHPRLGEGHPHVHGANLGMTLAAHDAAGGFAPLATGEDVDLVERLLAAGVTHLASDACPVLTSGRTLARAPEGFATFVAEL